MHQLKHVEFYVTNACNLSCDGCNRFNNLNLSGHDDWISHRDDYKNFLKHVDCSFITVLGGEPTMHPMINTILRDLRSYFPTKNILLTTNGLLLHKVKGLWSAIVDNKICLDLNVHNREWRVPVYNNLVGLIKQKFKLNWRNTGSGWSAEFTHKGVPHRFSCSDSFMQNSFGHPHGAMKPYNSDREKAWQACYSKCPTISEGKFFKCPISHCMPVAIRQRNDITYTESQKSLIDSFPYFKCGDIQNVSVEEFKTLVHGSIEQCTLCPESFKHHKINRQEISKNYF